MDPNFEEFVQNTEDAGVLKENDEESDDDSAGASETSSETRRRPELHAPFADDDDIEKFDDIVIYGGS